ncbi:MAG TPA: PepSY domain-containing protein [Stenotrophomonas sp.]|jgi:major membrane immunogen (membrane-anchored lipoprotein)
MNAKHLARPVALATLALSMALAGATAYAKPPTAKGQPEALTSAEVTSMLSAQGYRDVHDVKFEDGVWKADATSGDGKNLDLKVDPATGRVYPDAMASRMGEDDVRAALAAAGYSKVHDVEFDDGLWKAHAENRAGKDMKVQIDPNDGKVVAAEND